MHHLLIALKYIRSPLQKNRSSLYSFGIWRSRSINLRKIAFPLFDFKFNFMLFYFRLLIKKYVPYSLISGSIHLLKSPEIVSSIFRASAPMPASIKVHKLPGRSLLKSSTLISFKIDSIVSPINPSYNLNQCEISLEIVFRHFFHNWIILPEKSVKDDIF